jgi:hypothetical protein
MSGFDCSRYKSLNGKESYFFSLALLCFQSSLTDSASKLIYMRAVIIISVFVLFSSCQNHVCRKTAKLEVEGYELSLQRKEKELFAATSLSDVVTFLRDNPVIANQIFYLSEYPDTVVLAERIFGLVSQPSIDTLYQESVMAFELNETQLVSDLDRAFSLFKHFYPEAPVPKIQTIVTGLYHDMYISDETLIIGTDYFIGQQATYRANDIPAYILERYTYDYLAPTIMKFFVNPWLATGKESTVLSEMIDFGKTYYLLSQLFPCTPEYEIIGYSAKSMTDVNANHSIIWANFIQNEWLYETSDVTKKKFLGDRPNVYEIGDKCPGRIGAWVGWQIVKSYAEKSGLSVQEIVAETDHHKLFTESGYKPIDIK